MHQGQGQIDMLPLLTQGAGHQWEPGYCWHHCEHGHCWHHWEHGHTLGHSHDGLQLVFLMPVLSNCQWGGPGLPLCVNLPSTDIPCGWQPCLDALWHAQAQSGSCDWTGAHAGGQGSRH